MQIGLGGVEIREIRDLPNRFGYAAWIISGSM